MFHWVFLELITVWFKVVLLTWKICLIFSKRFFYYYFFIHNNLIFIDNFQDAEVVDNDDADVLPLGPGKVEFKNVSFHYKPERSILNDVSFTVEPGKTIALVRKPFIKLLCNADSANQISFINFLVFNLWMNKFVYFRWDPLVQVKVQLFACFCDFMKFVMEVLKLMALISHLWLNPHSEITLELFLKIPFSSTTIFC